MGDAKDGDLFVFCVHGVDGAIRANAEVVVMAAFEFLAVGWEGIRAQFLEVIDYFSSQSIGDFVQLFGSLASEEDFHVSAAPALFNIVSQAHPRFFFSFLSLESVGEVED